MRCEEIQERFVELLYREQGSPSAGPELRAHMDSCPGCRMKLKELEEARATLRLWKDEPPLRPVAVPDPYLPLAFPRKEKAVWRLLRFGAIAAALLIAFLVIANAEITWNKDGFSYRNNLFSREASLSDYYTRTQTRDIIKRAIDDSEEYTYQTNYQMLLKMLDTVERENTMDLQLVRRQTTRSRVQN